MKNPEQRATEGVCLSENTENYIRCVLAAAHNNLNESEHPRTRFSLRKATQFLDEAKREFSKSPENNEVARAYRERRQAERREQDHVIRRREYFTQSALIGLLRGRGDEAVHPEAFGVAAVALADATIKQLEETR